SPGRDRAADARADAGAGQLSRAAAVPPDLAVAPAALTGEIDIQRPAGPGFQAVSVAVHHDAVSRQRPLLSLDGGVAALQRDRGAVPARLPAQARVPEHV